MAEVRRASLKVVYQGKDISRDLAPFLMSATYTDYDHGQADDLSLTLDNRDLRWTSDWLPKEGDKITASILLENDDPAKPGRIEMPCGVFSVDRRNPSGPPHVFRISAGAALVATALRREPRTEAWTNQSPRQAAQTIADRNGFSLYWEGGNLPPFKRKDQRAEADLRFLRRLAEEQGRKVKVSGEKLIVYDAAEFEARPAVATLDLTSPQVTRYSLDGKEDVAFRECVVRYHDPTKKEMVAYRYSPEGAPKVGQVIWVRDRLESKAEAIERAKAELRKANSAWLVGTITTPGNPLLRAARNVALIGLGGIYDGRYPIKVATHTVTAAGDYTTRTRIMKAKDY